VDALRKRSSLVGAAATALLLAARPAPARADIFGDLFGSLHGSGGIISLLEALIGYVYPVEGMDPMPPTIDGRVLAGTQDPIGQAPGSYVTGNAPSRNPLFPPDGDPDWLPPDGASIYADLRLQDRGARADEAEALASAVTRDDQAAPARLDGYVLRNATPGTITEDVKLGNDVQIESAGQLHKLTSLQAEANQLQADELLRHDWAVKQADLYNRATLANGYWAGTRTWQPDQLP
jgi:hypothetical protein